MTNLGPGLKDSPLHAPKRVLVQVLMSDSEVMEVSVCQRQ